MLTPTPGQRQHPGLRLVEWSPKGNALIMVDAQFNILYKPLVGGPEILTLTDSGEPGTITNGVADWLYEGNISMLFVVSLYKIRHKHTTEIIFRCYGENADCTKTN